MVRARGGGEAERSGVALSVSVYYPSREDVFLAARTRHSHKGVSYVLAREKVLVISAF